MSYDDGPEQDDRLVKIFNKYKIKATFHLNSARFKDFQKERVKNLYAGHEVAVHSVNHPWLEKMPVTSVINQIMQDRISIEKECGYVVRGMSYPFGTYNDDVINAIKCCGIVYSRAVGSTFNFNLPNNFLAWLPTCHHNEVEQVADKFINSVESPWFSGLFYIWGHSFEFDNSKEFSWDYIERICKKLSGLKNVWYATNIEIYDYIQAQRSLQVAADESIIHNPSALDVWINKDKEPILIKGGQTLYF